MNYSVEMANLLTIIDICTTLNENAATFSRIRKGTKMPTIGTLSLTLRDYGGEDTTIRVNAPEITAANFAAQETLRNAFLASLAAMSGGSEISRSFGNKITDATPSNAPTVYDQRETMWRVDYSDDVTGEWFKFTIGTADLLLLDPNDRDHAHIGDAGDVDGFVTSAEAYMLSPNGNAITIREITHVGRNT